MGTKLSILNLSKWDFIIISLLYVTLMGYQRMDWDCNIL